MKKMFFPAVLAALSVSVFTARSATAANGSLTPHFKQSSYVNESVTLENKYVTMNFFKRIKGWGWGEILTPEGKLMAVMDHLGELMIRDQDIPMRFEADSVSRVRTDDGESLGQQVVERLAVGMALTELVGLGPQLLVGERLQGGLERIDALDGLGVLLDQPIVAAAENLLE